MGVESQKRSWFRLHLSTCVILLFTIGIIGVLNTRIVDMGVIGISHGGGTRYTRIFFIGWPQPFYVLNRDWSVPYYEDKEWPEKDDNPPTLIQVIEQDQSMSQTQGEWKWFGVVFDLICALGVVVLVGWACEWKICNICRKNPESA